MNSTFFFIFLTTKYRVDLREYIKFAECFVLKGNNFVDNFYNLSQAFNFLTNE